VETPIETSLLKGWTVEDAADAAGCFERTYRWLARFDAGEAMTDRSSAPHCVSGCTPASTEAVIEQLRLLRWTSTRIAAELNMATSTVGAVLRRLGLHRLSRLEPLEPLEPPNRYCRRHPGELIHIDVKKLGRFNAPCHRATGRGSHQRSRNAGWDYCHVAIDDTSRLAYVEILPDETGATCVAFLRRAIAFYARFGVNVERVMTDNGTGYRSKIHSAAAAELNVRHIRTRPYRPRTNGKAERFIQTLLREWAYAAVYNNDTPTTHPATMARRLQLSSTPQRTRPQDTRQPHPG